MKGQRYQVVWGDPERLPSGLVLDFHLWKTSSCSGEATMTDEHLGFANAATGKFSWEVPSSLQAGDDYFVEIRARASAVPSNYSSFFSVIDVADAPPTYVLYVENDVDLLSAFHRDCKKGDDWAIQPHFRIGSCTYSSAEGCRQYRTSRVHDGPPPYLHGSFLPLKDCTLHVVGLRQTMQLEGLTRGFDLTAEDNLAKVVANASQLPPGAVSISVVGGNLGRRLAATTGTVTLELSMSSDDSQVAAAALSLSSLSSNTPFLSQASSALGESSLSVSVTGNLSAVDGASAEVVEQLMTTTTSSSSSDGTSSSVDGQTTSGDDSGTTNAGTTTSGPSATQIGSSTTPTGQTSRTTGLGQTSSAPASSSAGGSTANLPTTTADIEGGTWANAAARQLGEMTLGCAALVWLIVFSAATRPE